MSSISRRRAARCVLAAAFVLGTGAAQGADLLFKSGYDESPEGPFNEYEASRFLTQASFGPTAGEIARLELLGYEAWIAEQRALPPSRHLPFLDAREAAGDDVGQHFRQEAWFTRAVTAPDQLRQRVAFALSEILVVSDASSAADDPFGLAHYYDVLVEGAFGNYRELLERVSRHPAMGQYLSSLRNRRADPALNIRPDENYAREVMQLFSIGLVRLNPDGTPLLVNGQQVPTYDQETIRGFARVFTGWNWSGCPADQFEWCWPGEEHRIWWRQPMSAFAAFHEPGTKQLTMYPGVSLPGGLLPAGGSAENDLEAALDNLFQHPNVGPFLARRLIQRLVTSNPSPAYVGRVAAVFANDGTGTRGNLGAMVRAILLDPEARRPTAPDAGKLREPLLRMVQLWRALDGRAQDGRFREWWPDWWSAQAALRSPTVFNFFLPDYAAPGEVAQAGLVSPEFQIATDINLTRLTNHLSAYPFWYWRGNEYSSPEDITVDLAPLVALAAHPDRLLDRLDLLFAQGRLRASTRAIIRAHIVSIPLDSWEGAPRERVQDAIWLITTSPEAAIER